MAMEFSTRNLHPRDRLAGWVEHVTQGFVKYDLSSEAGTDFDATVRTETLANLSVSTFECDPLIVGRSAKDIALYDSEDVFLCLQDTGRSVNYQDDRQSENNAGSFFLLDPQRPFLGVQDRRSILINYRIPRELLDARLGNCAAFACHNMPSSRSVSALVFGFLTGLSRRVGELDPGSATRLAEQVVDFAALALSVDGPERRELSSARASALLRLKAAIELRLCDVALKPAVAAAAAGMSVRHANALLAREGTSVERYILDRRLDRCRRTFDDPAHAHRTIGEIAFSWGFRDLSHFGRRFKGAFGLSPSDYRRCARKADTAMRRGYRGPFEARPGSTAGLRPYRRLFRIS